MKGIRLSAWNTNPSPPQGRPGGSNHSRKITIPLHQSQIGAVPSVNQCHSAILKQKDYDACIFHSVSRCFPLSKK
ncbi:hypothetical protein [Bacillus sonorensis]|uniref:Uncharacterized protein n=1 Tax=Bacillus sonorensis L12 TaxID=1274524 RepID=M5P152_9BACI|nr:hypothetical protein [Bacillus sonorensis]EME73179.1 hypothetical protein BSONL12_15684 [Bacillus sonorensis L12]MBG9914178.1 hypothetical protein [Bacillus sonorensis]MCY8033626.1 hypothetical protein [Bacillus sonorensis]MCY8403155.1 hypothetical protein [Bacillus sonorensis]MCY8562312.1 hypothetical protein [Bacillus sonorensis]